MQQLFSKDQYVQCVTKFKMCNWQSVKKEGSLNSLVYTWRGGHESIMHVYTSPKKRERRKAIVPELGGRCIHNTEKEDRVFENVLEEMLFKLIHSIIHRI